jgi:hypothetical protein
MKPAAQSKFRRYFIKIGVGSGFWKAALRITPHLPPNGAASPKAGLARMALSILLTRYVRSAPFPNNAAAGFLWLPFSIP